MDSNALLLELYGRVPPLVSEVVDGLDAGQLASTPAEGANSIGWLLWHLARVVDSHVAEIDGRPQEWEAGGFAGRFGLDPDPSNTGYGHTPDEARAVRPDGAETVLAYFDAANGRALALLDGLGPDDLDRVVDRRWDPPVTLGVRLVSVIDDCLEHLGQAAYARGVLGF